MPQIYFATNLSNNKISVSFNINEQWSSDFGDVLSLRFAQEEVSEDVVEELRVVVARAFAVRAPVDLQNPRRHLGLFGVVPENRSNKIVVIYLLLTITILKKKKKNSVES